ncbi:MAG TPA: pilus (MSHA type) biogenesis protein MshL [Rhodocyclaceae bacterium]|nr:pilus (MSHA type) biogenesis protein MshL [Rhodocyclaceae bacterium]
MPDTRYRLLALTASLLTLGGCSTTNTLPVSGGHLTTEPSPAPADTAAIPQPVQNSLPLTRPRAASKTETYSVVVNNVNARDLLFALARDAKLNVDIHPGIAGTVTLNAIDQTLQQLLTRIARQVDIRWEIDGPNLSVMPDTPFLRTYKIDYVNMSRDTSGSVTVTTQIASTGTGNTGSAGGTGGSSGGSSGSTGGNNSITKIENKSQNRFWDTLEHNIKDLLRETDKILPEGSSDTTIERSEQQSSTGAQTSLSKAGTVTQTGGGNGTVASQQDGTTVVRRATYREAASVIVNPETGIITVRATTRQHEKIQEFIDQVMNSARRQVLIEATIAEVTLSKSYQQGINWQTMPLGRAGFTLVQNATGNIANPASSLMQLSYKNAPGSISAAVNLLEGYGTVKVLSSPKLSVLNNQTAVLKVVDNQVYFTLKADTTANQTTTTTTYTTTVNSVPVGLVMNVTPQIDDGSTVLLNIRPSISRIVSYVADPNPALKAAGVTSQIPIIRTREMESMIRVDNGNIAVMGGLMEDTQQNTDNAIPGVSRIPGLGLFFQNRDDSRSKTELVVFLRPVVIKDASLEGDYRHLRDQLPGRDMFSAPTGPRPYGSEGSSP